MWTHVFMWTYSSLWPECVRYKEYQLPVNLLKPIGHFMYKGFNIKNFYVLPTQCIYVSCMDLWGKKQRFFAIQSQLIGLYTRNSLCLLRGRKWILNTVRLILVFKWLKHSCRHKGIAINSVSHMLAETLWIKIELVAQVWS